MGGLARRLKPQTAPKSGQAVPVRPWNFLIQRLEVVMFFVTGTALAAVSVLLLGLCYIGVRNPKNSKWTGDFLVGSVYVPGIMMLLSFSAALFYWFAKDFDTHPLNAVQGGQALVVVIAAVAAWRLIVKKVLEPSLMSAFKRKIPPPPRHPEERLPNQNPLPSGTPSPKLGAGPLPGTDQGLEKLKNSWCVQRPIHSFSIHEVGQNQNDLGKNDHEQGPYNNCHQERKNPFENFFQGDFLF